MIKEVASLHSPQVFSSLLPKYNRLMVICILPIVEISHLHKFHLHI